MGKINRFIVSVAIFSAVSLIGGVTVVHGQTQPSWFRGNSSQFHKLVEGRLLEVSQIENMNVCDKATEGSAACNAKVVIDANGRVKSSSSPVGGYDPSQFLGAYNLTGMASSTTGPIIAIVDAYDDPNIVNDLSVYNSTYGTPQLPTCSGSITTATSPCFEKVNEKGALSPLPKGNSSWDLEISLDVEVAHAICQNCRILLVEGNSAGFSDLLTAVDTAVANNAAVVSGSWGASEFSSETSYDSHFNKPGVAFTFSAGDNGQGTIYPAASPYVTAVGGTTLLLSGNSYLSESVWDKTGGGCSSYETAKPAWQTDTLCATRTMNDVSADADPGTGASIYDSVPYYGSSGWIQVGGTSLSSPLIAAVYAQEGVVSGVQENSVPYSQGNSSNINDVTTGNNGSCGILCDASVGYDSPTGLGTPNGGTAFSYPVTPDYSISVSPSSQAVLTGDSADYTVTSASSGGFAGTVTFSVNGLPADSTASFNPTTVTGSGYSTMTVSTASTTPAGTYALAIVGVSGLLTHTAYATLVVSVPPPPDFSISMSPTSVTVSSTGGEADYTATIIPTGGFSGSVTLSASGLPTGASGSFDTNPTNGTSTLMITVDPTTISGSYAITITGVSGSIVHTATVTLVKQSAQSFSLSANPSSLTIARGKRGSSKITVTPSGGFTGAVTLSVAGLPSDTSASFSTNPTTSSSTLTIKVNRNAHTGTYMLTVGGTSGSLSSTTIIALTVK